MENTLNAKSVVLISTLELQTQLNRLKAQTAALEDLQHAYADNDPRREVCQIALSSARQAVQFLEDSNV